MVAACGTVTGAAEALHYTPSAVSQQLRTLAKDLGVDLVVQDGRRIRLTPAARVLLDQTEDLYARWEEIRGLVAAAGDEGGGVLRLCGFSTAASALLPRVAVHLREARPTWQVRIIEVNPQKCFEFLLADQADIAVVVATAELPSTDDPRFELNQLLVDPLDLLLPQGHHLASHYARTTCGPGRRAVDHGHTRKHVPPAAPDGLRRSRLHARGRPLRLRMGHRRSAGRGRPRASP